MLLAAALITVTVHVNRRSEITSTQRSDLPPLLKRSVMLSLFTLNRFIFLVAGGAGPYSSLRRPAVLADVMDDRQQVALPSDGWRGKCANGVLF